MTLQNRFIRYLRAALAAAALAVVGTGFAVAQTVPAVTITAVASSPIAPATVTVTWSSTGATSCVASGDWTGPKALSGSQVFTQVRQSRSYTLACSQGTGSARVTWTTPTEWVDGDPMPATEPGSYDLFHAATPEAVPTGAKVTVPAPANAHVITGLPAGLRYFAVTAVSTEGVASDLSNIASGTVVLPAVSSTATVVVRRKPKAPTVSAVEATQGSPTVILRP